MKLTLIILALALAGCGTIWTVGFMGAYVSVAFPERPTLTASASVTTAPATQEAQP